MDSIKAKWYLLWTDFVDDYKPRGDWASSAVYFFETKQDAQKFIDSKLQSMLIKNWSLLGHTNLKEYFIVGNSTVTLKPDVDYGEAYETLEEVLQRAEYIERMFTYEIKEISLCT